MKVVQLLIMAVLDVAESGLQESRRARELTGQLLCWHESQKVKRVVLKWVITKCQDSLALCVLYSEIRTFRYFDI
jgi:hypothetical protein